MIFQAPRNFDENWGKVREKILMLITQIDVFRCVNQKNYSP